MTKKIFSAGVLIASGFTLLFAQSTNKIISDTSWHSGDTASRRSFDYNKRIPPALSMPDAYFLAFNKLGENTNQFYCLSATCLGQLPISSSSGPNAAQGWVFEFSSTNGIQKKIFVGFDKYVLIENM